MFRAAAAVALLCLMAPVVLAQANTDIVLPMDRDKVQLRKVTLMPGGLPERATGLDAPIDFSAGSGTAQSMVNSGQVSPAAGAAGGILGMMVVAAIDSGFDANRNRKIEEMLESQSFDAETVFGAALTAALEEGSIQAKYQAGTRPNAEFFTIVGTRDTPFDAAVDVLIEQYGYTIDMGGWVPAVLAQVKVHDSKTGALLMNEYVSYGRPGLLLAYTSSPMIAAYDTPGPNTVVVPYNLDHRFDDVDTLVGREPERAADALKDAMESTAKMIAHLVIGTQGKEVAAPPSGSPAP